MKPKTIVIIGAGPAGLTAALELLRRGPHRVIVVEASGDLGGISKTVAFQGNRIDIGGHRFFSKSDWVMNWWQDILPIASPDPDLEIAYQNSQRRVATRGVTEDDPQVMLVRRRLSRIYFEGKFFAYPVKANLDTALKLGLPRVGRMLASYGWARAWPRSPEVSLEDFLLNRFGRELYETFFKHYTEKVWGVPCAAISAAWGAQRIKGLSVTRALRHALRVPLQSFGLMGAGATPTSLIERFLYPKYGPGQMWETVAEQVRAAGGEIHLWQRAVGLEIQDSRARTLTTEDVRSGERTTLAADYVISTMPVADLIQAMGAEVPAAVARVAQGLEYRDFMTVGLLLRGLRPTPGAIPGSPINLVPDNWIYIQDQGVKVGRLQFFNNWSPYLVADPATVWVGMEYFCREGDALWSLPDAALVDFGIGEMETLGLARRADLIDGLVLRVPKAYPGYYGSYGEFGILRAYTDSIANLFLVGRNGMHRYNNQDHSMLTARLAVEAILGNSVGKAAIWAVNIDDDYHESVSAHDSEALKRHGD
jgi:protoporphyrinogen oxidase